MSNLENVLKSRVLCLDGAMGTMIQRYNLAEEDFRGRLPLRPGIRVRGANDLLVLTRPDVITEIHDEYIKAGADIIETDSFNANAISMRDYGLENMVESLNLAAGRLAREAADRAFAESGRKVFVAGSMGPSNISLSISTGADTGVDFEAMAAAYKEQASALIRSGVDILMLETIFDTLNAKAAIAGVKDALTETLPHDRQLPLWLSVTLTESGRTLSGQTLRGFLNSIRHANPLIVGLNCGFGAEGMKESLEVLQDLPYYISMHPNAGLPDEMGLYTETPEKMAADIAPELKEGRLNIVGGCCGTTPAHIAAISELLQQPDNVPANVKVRVPAEQKQGVMRLSGLQPLDIDENSGFLKVGERCNVAGSRKFLRLINEGAASEAISIAVNQVQKGAAILDVNMDDGMLDAPEEMERFVTLLGSEMATSALPLMIDSSDMEVVRRALRRIQGHPIVNSISLKEGEEKFLSHAREIRRLGASVVVMAFDERGQATDYERRIEICRRAYDLLIADGWDGSDIIFDPNILTIATGMTEHDRYALDFLDAITWIKQNLPGAKVSGGVSNLSFSFRGINRLREAMHTVFLHHAALRGMDMAIVNPASSLDITTVPDELREVIEDLIFMRDVNATSRLLEIAARMRSEDEAKKAAKLAAAPGSAQGKVTGADKTAAGKSGSVTHNESIESLIEKGFDSGLEKLLDEALASEGSAMGVVKNHLMAAMQRVGDEFGAGRMFLPQVVRAASVMKKAITYLTPMIEKEAVSQNSEENKVSGAVEAKSGNKRFVLATVKGDVHDIGKNIVGVVLRCSGFEVIDLGVMVEPQRIIDTVRESGAGFLGLSGLITPSLAEMCEVASRLEAEGLTDVVLCVGGATTSPLHTAVKIAPLFSGLTLHTRDAALLPVIAGRIAEEESTNAMTDEGVMSMRNQIKEEQTRIRNDYHSRSAKVVQKESAVITPVTGHVKASQTPVQPGVHDIRLSIAEVAPLINWKAFLNTWQLNVKHNNDTVTAESERLVKDAKDMLKVMEDSGAEVAARVALLTATVKGEDIVIGDKVTLPMLRSEEGKKRSIVDFIAPAGDWIGCFAVTTVPVEEVMRSQVSDFSEYESLLYHSLCDRLVEAATERVHTVTHEEWWGLSTPRSIRPAIGYPSIPDQTLVFELDKLLDYTGLGISLTENGALSPSATTTGLILANPDAVYFDIPEISDEAIADYARRRGVAPERLRTLLLSKSRL